jgi:CRISPR/Cas system CSM-associated protein Csm4 (group 5 of RAMP superfamily)
MFKPFSKNKPFNKDDVKIFDHVKIDRFTGGAIDSALYNEKVIAHNDTWKIEIILAKDIDDENIKKAFEKTLNDLCNGLLPLGGKVNRGYGIFEGSWTKEGCNDKE